MKRFESKAEQERWVNWKYAEKRDAISAMHPEWTLEDLYFWHSEEWDITEDELHELARREGYASATYMA